MKLTEAQLAEVQIARNVIASNKTCWVEIKPEWFATKDEFITYLVERKHKLRLGILDEILRAGRAALEEKQG